jgi:DNA relaxase NicK
MPASYKGRHLSPLGLHDTYLGKTLEIGTKTSSNFHCIYQKFRESEGTHLAIENPKWMRWESRFFRQSKMEIDIAIIHPDNWGDAFLGSSSYLQQLFGKVGSKFAHRVHEPKESAMETTVNGLLTLANQYGGLLCEAERLLGLEGLFSLLRRVNSDHPAKWLDQYDTDHLRERIIAARSGSVAKPDPSAAIPDTVRW